MKYDSEYYKWHNAMYKINGARQYDQMLRMLKESAVKPIEESEYIELKHGT